MLIIMLYVRSKRNRFAYLIRESSVMDGNFKIFAFAVVGAVDIIKRPMRGEAWWAP